LGVRYFFTPAHLLPPYFLFSPSLSISLCRTYPTRSDPIRRARTQRSTKVCVLDRKYEGDDIAGTAYALDESSFPADFFDDIEYSSTVLSISTASIRKSAVGRHGGGIISMKKGATATKERRGGSSSERVSVVEGLRGGNVDDVNTDTNSGTPFDRSRGRRLAQTKGNR
jgi:hypothetical protein